MGRNIEAKNSTAMCQNGSRDLALDKFMIEPAKLAEKLSIFHDEFQHTHRNVKNDKIKRETVNSVSLK